MTVLVRVTIVLGEDEGENANYHQDSGAKIVPRWKGLGSLRDIICSLVSLPTLRTTRASMTTASSKPSITQYHTLFERQTVSTKKEQMHAILNYSARNLPDGPKATI